MALIAVRTFEPWQQHKINGHTLTPLMLLLTEAANDGGGCDHPNPQEITYTSIFDELSCSSPIGERSTASLKTWGELHAQNTGTTLAGVVFDGGVVIGADTRSTSGDIVADKFTEKVCRLTCPNPISSNIDIRPT